MGIARIARTRWLAAPLMAATIGLAAPATATAATVSTHGPSRPDYRIAASATTEVSLGSSLRDPRGMGPDRWKRL